MTKKIIPPLTELIANVEPYDQDFIDLLSSPEFKTQLNCIKIFTKPMRTGKNYSEVNFRIRYVFETFPEVQFHLATAPDACIIDEWESDLKALCTEKKWRYETDPQGMIDSLTEGYKVIANITNAKAFVANSMKEVYDYLDTNKMFSKCYINCDEFHTWSLSDFANAMAVKGWVGDPKNILCVMYNLLLRIAAESPFTFSITATPNREAKGIVSTGGILEYELINALVAGEQKQYANRVGHLGEVHYYSNTLNLYGNNLPDRKSLWKVCLKTELGFSIETGVKRAILIPCADERDDRKHDDPTPEDFLREYVVPNCDFFDVEDDVEIGFVLTCDVAYSFNRKGVRKVIKLKAKDIISRINNIHDPSTLLIVKNMAGRGITLATVKAIFYAKAVDKKGPLGTVTEPVEQVFGRAKNVFVGTEQDNFWGNGDSGAKGDLNNVNLSPRSIKLLNQYNLYLFDNETMRDAVKNHRTVDACTWDMLEGKVQQLAEICPVCQRPFPKVEESVEELESYIDEHKLCYNEEKVTV